MSFSTLKLTLREIKGSLSRYFSIFAIIALGAGLFVGLRLSRPDFLETYNKYIEQTNFYDFRLVSTLGLTDEDVAKVKEIDGITDAEGVVSIDFYYNGDDGDKLVLTAQSIPDNINLIDIKEGKMPEKPYECLGDSEMYTKDDIGRKVRVSSENNDTALDALAYDEYTIVGITESVLYININRGSSSLGNGSIEGYLYIPKDGFSTDYYTDIYVTADAEGEAYSDEYKRNAEIYVEPLEKFMEERAVIRYDSIIDDATQQLADAEEQYNSGLQAYEAAKAEYDKGYNEFARQKKDAEAELNKAYEQITAAEALMKDSSVLDEKQAELNAAKAQLDAGKREYESGLRQFEIMKAAQYGAVESQIAFYENAVNELRKQEADINARISELNNSIAVTNNTAQLVALRAQLRVETLALTNTQNELAIAESRLQTHQQKKAAADEKLAPYKAQLDEAKAQLDGGYAQIAAGQAELDAAREMLAGGAGSIEKAKTEYNKAKAEAEEKFAAAEKELEEGKKQLDAAKAELDSGKAELDSAKKQIKEMENADTYVLGRNTNIGYVSFESDTLVVSSIAGVFPVFFFLVAALVCLTTMTRMISDERTQIGVMKALGYSSAAIMSKYFLYSGSATVFGSIFGIAVGSIVFPAIVWFGYGMIYSFSSLVFTIDWGVVVVITALNLLVTLAVTWYCCSRELKCAPSELIRPKAPEAGKRILLERLPFLWNKFNFMQKVSARNIMRYKKRIFMMLLGIGGCTALVLTALGLKDTMNNVVGEQYGSVMRYDYELSLAYDMTSNEQELFLESCGDSVGSAMFLYSTMADVSNGDSTKNVTLIASDGNDFSKYINLHNGSDKVAYPKAGEVVLNYNLARLMNLSVGDTVTVTNSDMKQLKLTVSGLFDNYLSNYAVVNLDSCAQQWGSAPQLKSAYIIAPEDKDIYACAEIISETDGVRSITVSEDTVAQFNNMMSALNYVILLVVFCAGLLAFIVLYNLTNINVSERIREIATIKVLGFYPNEAANYVFRENIVLTGAGALFGLLLGVAFHAFVMNAIKVDMMYCEPRIEVLSYLLAIVITFVFAIIVNTIMRRKIDGIDMAGALKSIE